MTNRDGPQVWTIWCAHSATDQGVTYAAKVTYALSLEDAIAQFENQFGAELSRNSDYAQGIVCNGVTRKLFSQEAFATMRKAEGANTLSAHASIHLHHS